MVPQGAPCVTNVCSQIPFLQETVPSQPPISVKEATQSRQNEMGMLAH